MFQDLLHTVTAFIMVVVVTITGVIHRPTPTPNKPVESFVASSSATISELPKPSSTPSPAKTSSAKKPTTTTDSNTNTNIVSPQPTQTPAQQYVPYTPLSQPTNAITVQPTATPTPTVTPTSTPTPVPFQPDPSITAKLDELRQILINIQNAPVAMNIIEGRKQAAYQKWMQNNFDAYAVISSNSYYLNLLNSIRRAYGV
ncbi:MAG: hypothetical protein Q7R97_03210 [Candidatus Daviesbacteria bacterium]|nr:hypothetical protein [Candidatus Daviesbacteria bacterium]